VPGLIELEQLEDDWEEETDSGRDRWTRRTKPVFSKFSCPLDDNAKCNLQLREASVTNLDEVGVFEKFFDGEVMRLIVKQTTVYANCDKNDHDFVVTVEEMRTFLAILMLSGYHSLPQVKMYWSTDEDIGVELVKRAMTRDRFLTIKK
jgi:hypothetical protein